MPSSAWAGWKYFESPVKVEAAKELSNCDNRCTPAVEEEDHEVMYSIDGIH